MRIAIGNDHVALEMKLKIKEYLQEKGIAVTDVGTDSPERCDYPIYGEKVANLEMRVDNLEKTVMAS